MINLLKFQLLFCAFFLSFTSMGQNPHDPIHNYPLVQNYPNIPLGVMPMQYNGSFAGVAGAPNLNTTFAKSRYSTSSYYSYYASYDQFIRAIGTGIGITAGYNKPSEHVYGHFISLAIAPKLSIKGKYTLSPSIDLSYYDRKENSHGMARNNGWKYTRSKFISNKIGILLNSRKFYVGYSVYVNNFRKRKLWGQTTSQKENSFISNLQFGYTFQSHSRSKFSFTPQLAIWITDEDYSHFNNLEMENPGLVAFNLKFKYEKVIWGLNNTGYQIGWQNDKLKVIASSNLVRIIGESDLNNWLGYEKGHELSVSCRYIFKSSDRKSLPSDF